VVSGDVSESKGGGGLVRTLVRKIRGKGKERANCGPGERYGNNNPGDGAADCP